MTFYHRHLSVSLALVTSHLLLACGGSDDPLAMAAECGVGETLCGDVCQLGPCAEDGPNELPGAGGAAGSTDRGDGLTSNPEASCEARNLMQYLIDISGTQTLSGQESMVWDRDWTTFFPSERDAYVYERVGKYPALHSSDFGDFDEPNLIHRSRLANVAEAYHEQGSIVQLHYHLIQPDQPDGSGFEVMHDFSSSSPYPAANIDAMLTPGDPLNVEHLARLDEIAEHLKVLRDAGVPVLWRPYHEMNGDWFWWCQQPRYKELWIQMWEHFTYQHELDNLLWVFSANWWSSSQVSPDEYYPGHDYVDVLGVDIYAEYGHSYEEVRVHDHLLTLGEGKPIAITENGEMPPLPSLALSQPAWVYWATWFGFEGADHGNTDQLYSSVYGDPRTLTQDEVNISTCP